MKKFKVSFVAVFAIIIGMAASSFTVYKAAVKKTTSMNWYEFTGSTPSVAADYSDALPGEPECNSSPEVVCSIYAHDDNGKPNQDDLDAINSASNGFTQTAENLKYRPAQ